MSTCILVYEYFKMKCFCLDYIIDESIYHLLWKYEILLIWREKHIAIFFFTYLLILMFYCWDSVLHVRYIAKYFVFRKKTDLVLNYVPKQDDFIKIRKIIIEFTFSLKKKQNQKNFLQLYFFSLCIHMGSEIFSGY